MSKMNVDGYDPKTGVITGTFDEDMSEGQIQELVGGMGFRDVRGLGFDTHSETGDRVRAIKTAATDMVREMQGLSLRSGPKAAKRVTEGPTPAPGERLEIKDAEFREI